MDTNLSYPTTNAVVLETTGLSSSTLYLLGFTAVVVILGIIFISMTVRTIHRQNRKVAKKRRGRELEQEFGETPKPDDIPSQASTPRRIGGWKSQADSAYRDALRKTHRGEQPDPQDATPGWLKNRNDLAYREALRKLHDGDDIK